MSAVKKLSDENLAQAFDIMTSITSSQVDVGIAGCKLLVALYGEHVDEDTLPKMRYNTYMKLYGTSKSAITPEQLQPTERAGYFHSLRTHYQVADWIHLLNHELSATDWGWVIKNDKFLPQTSTADQQPAPDELLKVIRCSCKTSSRNQCATNLCSCRRNGLSCMSACSNCHSHDCNNCQKSSKWTTKVLMTKYKSCLWMTT